MFNVFRAFRLEGVKYRLVLARRMNAALDAQLADGIDKAEARRDDADRAHHRAFIGVDLVAGAGQPVAARGGHVFAEDDDRDLLLIAKLADSRVNQG